MKIQTKDFRVKESDTVNLKKWDTLVSPLYTSKEEYLILLDTRKKELAALQSLLYASGNHAMLLIFQGMDASGKDGAIKHVMSGINPQGVEVVSFKQPSAEELAHDFLWRETCKLPMRGRIGIFNRSYYEEVLIIRVHPEFLHNQGIFIDTKKTDKLWNDRYTSITNFEDHLSKNGTHVLKFFLHISKDEQKKRFIERIDNKNKSWKFVQSDFEERKYWQQYQHAYQECFSHTSSKTSPWYIVPADDKLNARLIVSQVVVDTLKKLDMKYPEVTAEHHKELLELREQLQTL